MTTTAPTPATVRQQRRPRAALFDLDGVLLDSGSAVTSTLAAVATYATGRRHTPDDLPADALTRPRRDVLADLGIDDPDTACTKWWDGALVAAPPAAVFPGVLTALRTLRTAGTAIGVVTLQYRARLGWLLPPDLADLLDVVVTREDAPHKPAPDGVHTALDKLGVHPQHAVMVGDSPGDIHAARRAGALAVGVAWGYHPATALRDAGARQILRAPAGLGTPLLEHLSRRG